MLKIDPVSLNIGDKEMAMSDQDSGLKTQLSCNCSQSDQNKTLLTSTERIHSSYHVPVLCNPVKLTPYATLYPKQNRLSVALAAGTSCDHSRQLPKPQAIKVNVKPTEPQVSTKRELISESTYALCTFAPSAPSISRSRTASTSIGGFKPSTFARFQRFSLAMPIQG